MQPPFPKPLAAGASDIGQLTDVLRDNLQDSCHASVGMVPRAWPARPGPRPGRPGRPGPASPGRLAGPGRGSTRPGHPPG
jgi:hypothetical protein